MERTKMEVKEVAAIKMANDTMTASAASVGVMTFLGIAIVDWVQILTIIWFLILISKWIKNDVYPWVSGKIKIKMDSGTTEDDK